MKTSKKILSIVLALVLMTTMVTSAFYASACSKNNHDAYKEAVTVLDTLDQKLDAYDVDLIGMLNGLLADNNLDSKTLIKTVNGYIDEESLNSLISEFAGKYLESGQWLIDLGNEKVVELLNQYLNTGVTDPLLANLTDTLNKLISGLPDVDELRKMLPTIKELDAAIDKAVGEYLNDGSKLVEKLDQIVADAIDGQLIYDSEGRKVLKGMGDELAAKLDKIIEDNAGEYLNDGEKLISLADRYLMDLLKKLEINGTPVLDYLNLSTLDGAVSDLVLADNSSIMQTAANALKGLFPNIQPNYDSIVSSLIPLLSAFNFSEIMANMSNIGAMLQLASPSGFAYLAGLNSEYLTDGYLDTVNANLAANGYTGPGVTPLIELSAEDAAKLLEFVEMEKGGKSLQEIADAGFDWTQFMGDADRLDVANAFIKIALGDKDKLGSITEAEGVGPALVNLLCDLINDLKSAPVTTLITKLSDAEGLAAIADFAMGLLNGPDSGYKSYDLFFTDKIYYDKDGNTTFYDKLDEEGNPAYTGPKAMDQYLPVIAAGLDLLDNLKGVIDSNNGDLLKTLLVDKLPQFENLIKSAISYKDAEGKLQPGLIAYLLDDYATYLQAANAVLSYNVLKGLQEKAIEEAQAKIADYEAEIAIWQQYLEQVEPAAKAAKLQKAKALGLLADDATEYDEETVKAAIEAQIAELSAKIEQDNANLVNLRAAYESLDADARAKREAADSAVEYVENTLYDDPFLSDLQDILDNQDANLINQLRADCEDDMNTNLGEGAFDEFAAVILENMADYDDAEAMVDDYLLDVGYGLADTLDQAATTAEGAANDKLEEVNTLSASIESDSQKLAKHESGATFNEIEAAGDSAKIHISDTRINAEGDFSASDIQGAIDTINSESIANAQATIAESQAKIQEYNSAQAEQQSIYDGYDKAGLDLEQETLNNLVEALMTFIGGDEDSKSLYEYFSAEQPIEMLLAPDRVQALKEVVDGVITIIGDRPETGSEYETNLWKIEDILFGDEGILTTFYDDFKADPVLSVAKRIAPLTEVADVLYDMGLLQEQIDQYRDIIDDAADLFGNDDEGFIKLWKQAYEDGTAKHHYTNAILSLLPKLVQIYDDLVEDVPAIAEAVEPYKDAIEYVLNLLTKDLYDNIMEDGFVETILTDEKLNELQDVVNGVLANLEDGAKYKQISDVVFDDVLDGIYDDIIENPVTAVAKRINAIADAANKITDILGVDISDYKYIIEDIKNIFDKNFSDDWNKSKVSALVNRVPALMKLIQDVSKDENILKLINDNVPEEYKSLVGDVLKLLDSATNDIKNIANDLVNDYNADPLKALVERVPDILDLLTSVTGSPLVDKLLALDAVKDIALGNTGLKVSDISDIVKSVCKHFTNDIAPELQKVLTEDTLNTYANNKIEGLAALAGGAANILRALAKDSKLINDVLALDPVKNIKITDDLTVGDISGLIKAVAAMLPEILDGVDLAQILSGLETQPTKTIIDLFPVIVDAIDAVLGTSDPTIYSYVKQFKNTITLVRDILNGISLNGKKIKVSFLSSKTPIDDLLSPTNIKRLKGAAKEITNYIDDPDISKFVNSITDLLDGLVEDIKAQPLLKTVEQLGDGLRLIISNARNIPAIANLLKPYNGAIDAALNLLDGIYKDSNASFVGAILNRVDKLRVLVNELFKIDAFANIEVLGYKLSDFRSLIDILFDILGGDFYSLYKENPLKAIFSRIEDIKALYNELKSSGLLDAILKAAGFNPVIYGYNILTLVEYLLPILDKDLYDDFEESLIYAVVAKGRIHRVETALKNIIWYLDLLSNSVNSGLCSVISGIIGVLDGLYEDLKLPASPANGGNVQNSTARVIVSRFPQIQAFLDSLKPLLGNDGKLINLTDLVSDVVKMEKDDILKMVAGVDLLQPYYYGIGDAIDVIGEESAKGDWNTIPGIVNSLNIVGAKLIPTLEDALGVKDVKWVDLVSPDCNYDRNGTPESYLVEFTGEVGEGILTPLVGTLLKAALTIPAVEELLGEGLKPEDVADMLNQMLEFDFKDNKVEFDAFNTEHLIYTAVGLLLPKSANDNSPATADEIVMIAVAAGTFGAACVGVYATLKKRRKETVETED